MWCDQAKSVWSRSNSVFIFLTNCMHHFHSYILQKTPLKLVNWFQRYEQLKDAKNNRKQKTFSALFGSILKSIFPTSDWFCLITQIFQCYFHLINAVWAVILMFCLHSISLLHITQYRAKPWHFKTSKIIVSMLMISFQGGYSSMIWVGTCGTCHWDLKSRPIFIPNFAEKWDPFLYQSHKF